MKSKSTSGRHRMGPWVLMGTIFLTGCRHETAEPLLNRDLGSGGNLVLLPTRPLQLDSAITLNARVQLIELVDPEQEALEAVDHTMKTPQDLILNFTVMMEAGRMQEVAGFLVNPEKMQEVRKILIQTVMLVAQRKFGKIEKLLSDKHPDEFQNINLLQKVFETAKLEPASDGSDAVDVNVPKPNGGMMTFRIPLMKSVSGLIFDPDLEGAPDRMLEFVNDIKAYQALLESDTLDGKGARNHLMALYVKGLSVLFPDAPEKADFTLEVKAAPPQTPAQAEAEPAQQ